MTLTQEQISRLWKLSALNADSRIEIDAVLDSFDTISEVNTGKVDHISRSGATELRLRDDVITEDETLHDKLLSCSPQKVAAHQIVLAGIMHGE